MLFPKADDRLGIEFCRLQTMCKFSGSLDYKIPCSYTIEYYS